MNGKSIDCLPPLRDQVERVVKRVAGSRSSNEGIEGYKKERRDCVDGTKKAYRTGRSSLGRVCLWWLAIDRLAEVGGSSLLQVVEMLNVETVR